MTNTAPKQHVTFKSDIGSENNKKGDTVRVLTSDDEFQSSHEDIKLLRMYNEIRDINNLDNKYDKQSEQYLSEKAKELFTQAASVFKTPQERRNFLDRVTSDFLDEEKNHPELPSAAPELYKCRATRSERPEEFLSRVYGPWLHGNGLFRSHIKAWDLSLYQALYQRRDVIKDFDKVLPKAQGRTPQDIARSDAELLESRRASNRRSMAKAKP